MPRYFFNTRIGDDTIPDVEGEELRDADHAWEVAKAMIVDLLEDEGDHPNLLTAALVVTDQKGEVVLEFPFSEALIAEPEPHRHGIRASPFPRRATPPIFAAMAKSPNQPRDPAKHSKKDPARPTRSKAHRPDSAPTDPALERLLNPGIEKGTAGMGSGTGLQPPPDNSFERRADRRNEHTARKSTVEGLRRGAAARLCRRARRSTSTPNSPTRSATTRAIRTSR